MHRTFVLFALFAFVSFGSLFSDPSVDSDSIALVGWSNGGVAHTILQMRNSTIVRQHHRQVFASRRLRAQPRTSSLASSNA